MVTIAFSDDIIKASELRKEQKYWFDRASSKPITVTYGSRKFTIMDRDKIYNLYLRKYYLELVIKYCDEMVKGVDSNTFPWIIYLDDEEKEEFHNELIITVAKAVTTNDWATIEELIEDWKATAETKNNPAVMKALKTQVNKDKLVTIK